MGDAYWNRQVPLQQQQQQPVGLLKRPRNEYDLPQSGAPATHEMHHYLGRDNDLGGPPQIAKDSQTIGSAYDRYLQSSQLSSITAGEASNYGGLGLGRAGSGVALPSLSVQNFQLTSMAAAEASKYEGVGLARPGSAGGLPAIPARNPVPAPRGTELTLNGGGMVFGGQLPVQSMPRPRETLSLPHDASSTLYIEGLPADCKRREVAHIFRPFVGYREVRLVRKESKHRSGDPLILCFVDFVDPACAATALSALQGYKLDAHDPDSAYLRLQFSKHPGPRSGGSGSRGKR